MERGALVVMAAEGKDAQKKKMPSPVKRALLSEERRVYNKSHKSACATRVKKVRCWKYGLNNWEIGGLACGPSEVHATTFHSLAETQVVKLAETLVAAPSKTEEEVKNLEKLISEAYTEIDKAVVKGILHENTAARKKARCARWKKTVLMAAGLYKPAADSPDFARYQKLVKA